MGRARVGGPLLVTVLALALAGLAYAHGNVTPQPVDTAGLKALGDNWVTENPYRADKALYEKSVEIGEKGYELNCVSCHGLHAVAGGMAPDLRELDAGKAGDEWYIGLTRKGVVRSGETKMPAYEGTVSQEAMWAIRSYLETRPH
jgi:cytochrome c-550 PedF